MSQLPFNQACENNKPYILEQLQLWLKEASFVLEIGTGTAQHAVYFADNLPDLKWQTSDLEERHLGIKLRLADSPCENLYPPLEFEIGTHDWPNLPVDAVFTANTTHIMSNQHALQMMTMVAKNLPAKGVFCQYGPFNIGGEFTSESNREFDQHLKLQGYGGIMDIAQLEEAVAGLGLTLVDNVAMPANNRLLVWRKTVIL